MTPPPGGRAGGWDLLGGLLSPLRLPERVLVAIESIAERLEDVHPMREEVETIRRQSAVLDELLPALTSMKEDLGSRLESLHELILELEGIEAGLDKRVGELCQEITAMHRTVGGLKGDVERVTERLPDPNEPGPLERARDVLTGGAGRSASAERFGPTHTTSERP